MSDRPELTIKLKRKEFLEYYYLTMQIILLSQGRIGLFLS